MSRWDWDEDDFECDHEDPPLYESWRIAAMTDAELIAEANRQCRIHDSAIDRCVEMGSPIIENAAGRLNICDVECDRRGIRWLDVSDEETPLSEESSHG